MSAAFGPWDASSVLDICCAMRPADRREAFAMRRDDDPFSLFADLVRLRDQALWFEVVYDRDLMGVAVAFFGVYARSPCVGGAAMIATAEITPRQAALVARRVREVVIPDLLKLGVRRVDCECWDGHAEAKAFLKRCGAEAMPYPRRSVGKRGEDFREHVWLADTMEGYAHD